jgi:hypothetical protein
VVETVGDWVVLTPPLPLLPPPHPIIQAFDSRIAVSIIAAAGIAKLRFLKRVNEPIRAGTYSTSLFNYPRILASNLGTACDRDLKVITPPADAVVPMNTFKYFIPERLWVHLLCYQFAANLFPTLRI